MGAMNSLRLILRCLLAPGEGLCERVTLLSSASPVESSQAPTFKPSRLEMRPGSTGYALPVGGAVLEESKDSSVGMGSGMTEEVCGPECVAFRSMSLAAEWLLALVATETFMALGRPDRAAIMVCSGGMAQREDTSVVYERVRW